jgi:hypothetical protein
MNKYKIAEISISEDGQIFWIGYETIEYSFHVHWLIA